MTSAGDAANAPHWPTPCPPPGVDPYSGASLRQYLSGHEFPFADQDHCFHFVYLDHVNRLAGVRLRHGLAGHRTTPDFLAGGEGVFILAMRAPAVRRIEYQLVLVDRAGVEQNVPDPLNPCWVRDPFSVKSVAFADGYAVPIEAGPPLAAARGTLLELDLPLTGTSNLRAAIWQPPDSRREERLPIVVFLDGGDYLKYASLQNIIENLQYTRRMARCRAVFISPSRRNDEYSANPQTADIVSSLTDALGKVIPVPSDPSQRIGVGASLGGLCLLHAHLTATQFFGGLLLQSGSFFQPTTDQMELGFPRFRRISEFVRAVLDGSARGAAIPVYMTCGRGGENLPNNRVMAESLRAHGFQVSLVEHPDAHNWTSWRDCIGRGLVQLLPGDQAPRAPD